MVQPPRQNVYYPDRPLDCEEALETALYDLMGSAVALGWTPAEIRLAIRRFAAATRGTTTKRRGWRLISPSCALLSGHDHDRRAYPRP
jgi:hypothetical protein